MPREKSKAGVRAKSVGVAEFKTQDSSTGHALSHIWSEKPESKNFLQRNIVKCLHAPAFEYSMGSIIVFNIIVLIAEIDSMSGGGEASRSAPPWTEAFGWVVLFIFAVELCLRVFAFRRSFWIDAWNVFDFIVVSTDFLFSFLALVFGNLFPVTILRIFRLAKLARVCKVLRVFAELRMLLSCIARAMSAIFWGAVLLGLMLLGWSMAAVMFIHPLNREIVYDDCERCARAYSSVMQAALTFWRQIVAGDSWGLDTVPLLEKHPGTVLFFIPLFLTLGMTVLSLILGMIVSVATEAKDEIKEVDNAQATATKLEKQSNLLRLCKEMDTDRSGDVSLDELLEAFEKPGEFRNSMEMLGITREDFDVVWALMDADGGGAVPYKKLVSRLYGLKTSNYQFTLAYLKYHVTNIKDILAKGTEDEDEANGENNMVAELHRVRKTGDMLLERQEQFLEKLQAVPSLAVEQGQADEENNILAELNRVRKTGDMLLERQEQFLEKLQAVPSLAVEQGHKGACDAPQKEGFAVEQEHKGACNAPQKEDKAIENSRSATDEVAKGSSQIQILLEKLFLELEKEYNVCEDSAQPANEKISQPAEGGEHQIQASMNQPLLGLSKHLNTHIYGSQGEAVTRTIDEMQNLFKTICHDIEMLRSELKDTLRKVDRKFGSTVSSGLPHLSALDRAMSSESQLDLLVVPEKGSSCSIFNKCK